MNIFQGRLKWMECEIEAHMKKAAELIPKIGFEKFLELMKRERQERKKRKAIEPPTLRPSYKRE